MTHWWPTLLALSSSQKQQLNRSCMTLAKKEFMAGLRLASMRGVPGNQNAASMCILQINPSRAVQHGSVLQHDNRETSPSRQSSTWSSKSCQITTPRNSYSSSIVSGAHLRARNGNKWNSTTTLRLEQLRLLAKMQQLQWQAEHS